MKQHHYGSHGEKIGKRSVICDWCNQSFKEWESELQRTERTFCDNECFGKWQSSIQKGEDNPNWLGGKLKTHTCKVCGSEYENYKQSSETSCCSEDCYTEILEQRTGEDCASWKGGAERYYGNIWTEQREKAIKEAGERCEECSIPRIKHKQNYGKDLHVHHIQPYRTFDDDKEAHKLDNLVAVCRDCHYDLEYNRNS